MSKKTTESVIDAESVEDVTSIDTALAQVGVKTIKPMHPNAGKVVGFMLYGYFEAEDKKAYPIVFEGRGDHGVSKIFTTVESLVDEYYAVLYDEDWGFEEEDIAAVFVVMDYDGNLQFPASVTFRVPKEVSK